MRDRSAPQDGLSAAKRGTTRIDGQRRQSRLPSVPLCAAHRSHIREWYAIMPPAPNTWPLNIERLDQFRPRRDFLSERSPLPRQCGAFATYRRISCLLASTICRCIAARRIGWSERDSGVPITGRISWSAAGVLPIRGGDDQNQGREPYDRDEASPQNGIGCFLTGL